jgi:hypothetical protein
VTSLQEKHERQREDEENRDAHKNAIVGQHRDTVASSSLRAIWRAVYASIVSSLPPIPEPDERGTEKLSNFM